jgi:ABC-type dipeptide/oligopeptide/nickel transport system ATPase component
MTEPALAIHDVVVDFHTRRGVVRAIDGVSLALLPGETVGLLGETGSGKSVIAWSALGLVPPPGRIERGEVYINGANILAMPEEESRRLRGKDVALIVQNARAHLNPLQTIGAQIANVYTSHTDATKSEAWSVAVDVLKRVAIPDPEQRAKAYPHELSGGMAQRAMIAMATVNSPQILIADEPTMGLDVTIQAQVLDLLADHVRTLRASTLLITRDLGIVAKYCQRVAVLRAGQLVEMAAVSDFFEAPQHAYSIALLSAAKLQHVGGEERPL